MKLLARLLTNPHTHSETLITAKRTNRTSQFSITAITARHSSIMRFIFAAVAMLSVIIAGNGTAFAGVAYAIRAEANQPSASVPPYPLPLLGSWNTGNYPGGFGPDYQMGLLNSGHYILPWFQLPSPNEAPLSLSYYETALKRAAQLRLPISFIGVQWESLLSSDTRYFDLPPDQNPNVVTTDGTIQHKVSPFGPKKWWHEVGYRWTSTELMRKLQELYPNPPLVLFLSNNEQPKLTWTEVETSQRYMAMYGAGRDDNFKRQVVGAGWIERYRELQNGMRDGLLNSTWKQNVRFVGYDAFGSSAFGRWPGWIDYSLYIPGRIEPWPLAWDGASPSYYVNNWDSSTDYQVQSPQIETMNWVFMQKEAHALNPNFWFEMSVWDGHTSTSDDKRAFYANQYQYYGPDRYAGMVKFGLWLLRPRLVREYRGWTEQRKDEEPYFIAIVNAVDRIHLNSTLRYFWRNGRLVPNQAYLHPYQANIPAEYQKVDRNFLLDTSLDPPRPWALNTKLPVYSLAVFLGSKPKRKWLVYAFSPLGDRQGVSVHIPDYGWIKINATVGGTYYQVVESTKSVSMLRE